MMHVHIILYVLDQTRSTRFYALVLGLPPRLDVPGMTEFLLESGTVLGLMPAAGVVRLLGDSVRDPREAAGIPRAEVYLLTTQAADLYSRALLAGARELSPIRPRDWGHRVGYVADPDGHVLAFAEVSDNA